MRIVCLLPQTHTHTLEMEMTLFIYNIQQYPNWYWVLILPLFWAHFVRHMHRLSHISKLNWKLHTTDEHIHAPIAYVARIRCTIEHACPRYLLKWSPNCIVVGGGGGGGNGFQAPCVCCRRTMYWQSTTRHTRQLHCVAFYARGWLVWLPSLTVRLMEMGLCKNPATTTATEIKRWRKHCFDV